MHVEFRLLNVEHVCAFEAHSYELVDKLCALQPDSISQTAPSTSSEHPNLSPLHHKERKEKQLVHGNALSQEHTGEEVEKMTKKSATRVSKSTGLCSNDMVQTSTEVASRKKENMLCGISSSTLGEVNRKPHHNNYVYNREMTENMSDQRQSKSRSATRAQSISRKECINEDTYHPVIRIQFIFENAIKIESSNLSLQQERSKGQYNLRKHTYLGLNSTHANSNNDTTKSLYSYKVNNTIIGKNNSINNRRNSQCNIRSENNINRNVICTRSCHGTINEVLLASLPIGFLSLPVKIRILQLKPNNDKSERQSHDSTNSINDITSNANNEVDLAMESTLCIGVAKVNFGKVAKTPGSVCVVLQPKSNIAKMVNDENTRWQTRLRSLTTLMSSSEETLLSPAVNNMSSNSNAQFCSFITGNGSAQLTFQIIVYSFAKIPRHRLLLCDRRQCTQSAQEQEHKELNEYYSEFDDNNNYYNDNAGHRQHKESMKAHNFTVQNTKGAASKRVMSCHELCCPSNDLFASANKSPSPNRTSNVQLYHSQHNAQNNCAANNNHTNSRTIGTNAIKQDSSGSTSNSLPLLMLLSEEETNSGERANTTHSSSSSIYSLSNTLNALTNNNIINGSNGDNNDDETYMNNHINTIKSRKENTIAREVISQNTMESEFRSPAVRFALVPYIALIHIILTNHHLLMWHRPIKSLLFVMILLFTLIADIFDTGVVLFLCAELLFLLRTTFLFYRIRRAETSQIHGLVSESDESSHNSIVYLYGRQHSLLNAMVRARLFFLRGLQEDCFYELIFVFHIIYHKRSTLLRLSVALLCVKLCFSLETLFIITLLITVTCYPVYIRLSSPWVAETRSKQQDHRESNEATSRRLSQSTQASSLSFLPLSVSQTTKTITAIKNVLGLSSSSTSTLTSSSSSPYTEPSAQSDRRTYYLRDKSKWHLWRMQWKSNAPMRVVRVVQVSVKASPQTTQHVRRSYEAGLRDGLKYAAMQYKRSLPSTHNEPFVSTNTISITPTRSTQDAAIAATSPSPQPLVTERAQMSNDNTSINIITMHNNLNNNNSNKYSNDVSKGFTATTSNDYRQEKNALLHMYDNTTETGKTNNKSGIDSKLINKISPVHTPTIPIVAREDVLLSASVKGAGNDWKNVSNSYSPVNNVISVQTNKFDNEAHKRVHSWNVMDRWARSWGNYNELKSFNNPLESSTSAKKNLNMTENKAKISMERLEDLGHIRQVSATFNAPVKLYGNDYSTNGNNNTNNSNMISCGLSRVNTNMTGMSVTRHSALSFAVVVFTLNHLHDDTLSNSFALSNEVANRESSVACSSPTPANNCDIFEEHNTLATEARMANRRNRALSSLLVRLEKHNKALHRLQQCITNSTSNNKGSNVNNVNFYEQSLKEKNIVNDNNEECQALQSYFKETLSFLTYLRRMWNPHAYLAVSPTSFTLSCESMTGVIDRAKKEEGKSVKPNDKFTNIVEANNKLEIDANSGVNVNDSYNEDEHKCHSALTNSNNENEVCKTADEEKQYVNYFVRREWLASGNKVDGLSGAVFAMPNNTFSLVKVPGVNGCDREARTMALLAAHLLQGNSFTLFIPPSTAAECEEHLPTRLFAVNNTDRTNNVASANFKMIHGTTFSNTFHNATASLSADLTASGSHSTNPATLIGLVSGSDYIARLKTPNPCPQQLLNVLEKIWRGEATLPSLHPRTLINADLVLQIIHLHKEGKLGYSTTNRESDDNTRLSSKNNHGANWNVCHAEYVDHDKTPLITVLKLDDKITNTNAVNE